MWQRLNHVQFEVADLPGTYLALTRFTRDQEGHVVSSTITIDQDAAGYGWFVDPTPGQSEEFVPITSASTWQLQAPPDSPAAGKIDLLTTIYHELGHAIGLGHADPAAHPGDVMSLTLQAGVRSLPTSFDVTLRDLDHEEYWGGLQVGTGFLGSGGFSAGGSEPSGSQPLLPRPDFAPAVADPPVGLVNGEFTVSQAADPAFGWSVRGAAGVENGAAVLREGDRVLSHFAQTFVVPEQVQALQFTLDASGLAGNGIGPQDALEVALLNTQTGASLLGTATGLTQTDAALNLQQDGHAFESQAVRLSGLTTSGGTVSLAGTKTVTVDLRGVQAGTRATLYVDLLGFGPQTSVVTLDHVALRDRFNTDPVVQAGADVTVDEGTSFTRIASFSDPDMGDSWTATVDYGDGTGVQTLALNQDQTFTLAHPYADEGLYTVTVAVTDGLGSVGQGRPVDFARPVLYC